MEYINPYKLFVGSFIPNWLLKMTTVSQGAKLCYARLCQYAGQDGKCYPLIPTLAQEIGVKERQAKRYLVELREQKLIHAIRRGLGLNNDYYFLRHPAMFSDVPTEVSDVTSPEVSDVTPTLKENHNKRIITRESEDFPIPVSLQNKDFLSAWEEWLAFRKTELKKPIKKMSATKQLKFLSLNSQDAVAIINQSITNGYQGLFPLKNNYGKNTQSNKFNGRGFNPDKERRIAESIGIINTSG